jgi:hypothetical protein
MQEVTVLQLYTRFLTVRVFLWSFLILDPPRWLIPTFLFAWQAGSALLAAPGTSLRSCLGSSKKDSGLEIYTKQPQLLSVSEASSSPRLFHQLSTLRGFAILTR